MTVPAAVPGGYSPMILGGFPVPGYNIGDQESVLLNEGRCMALLALDFDVGTYLP